MCLEEIGQFCSVYKSGEKGLTSDGPENGSSETYRRVSVKASVIKERVCELRSYPMSTPT
jgi:hypothetical protein